MAKLILSDITSGYAAPTTINANNLALRTAFDNTLSRDGTAPNTMLASLDMNSHTIINLGAPANGNDAVRYQDLISGVVNLTGVTVPTQTGNADKFLKTDGTNPLWAQIDLSNTTSVGGNIPIARFNSGTGASNTKFWRGDGTWASTLGANVAEPFTTITDGATVTVDCTATSSKFIVTLGGNRTVALSSPVDGQSIEVWFKQDGTGGRTITWPGNVVFEGGHNGLSTIAGTIDRYVLTYNSSQNKWLASANLTVDIGALSDITLEAGSQDLYLFALAGFPVAAGTYNFTISQGINIHATSTATPAIDTSGFPGGSTINLFNSGYIDGKGGDAGAGASIASARGAPNQAANGNQAQPGRTGGNAILGPGAGRTLNIYNANGFIRGGGGGGGGGGASFDAGDLFNYCNGGGGGGGAGGGKGGRGGTAQDQSVASTNGTDGTDGGAGGNATFGTGGAEASNGNSDGGVGGVGGAFGAAGSAGGSPTAFATDSAGGAAGPAGKAVELNAGTVNFISGNDATHVKGAVS